MVFEKKIAHPNDELAKYKRIFDQYPFRKELIINELKSHDINFSKLSAVVGRGGLLKAIPRGTYEISEKIIEELRNSKSDHASNLGALLLMTLQKRP